LFGAELPGETPAAAGPARVVSTDSRLLFQALDGVYAGLGLGALGDDVFRDLVLARVVEPTSILDTGRVLTELGRKAASDKTMRRTLARCADRGYPGGERSRPENGAVPDRHGLGGRPAVSRARHVQP
jgi:hypothetical protein